MTEFKTMTGWMVLRSPRPAAGGSSASTRLLPLLVLALTLGAGAEAQTPRKLGGPVIDGSVVIVDGCGEKFFIAYQGTYALAQRLNGEMVKREDVLQGVATQQGSFDREGRMEVTDLTTGKTLQINIENAMLSQSAVHNLAGEVCR